MKKQIKPKIKLQPTSQEGKSGFPDPIKAKCFKCRKVFWIKFVVPQRDYSKKNNWGYWTEKSIDQHKYICSPCLRSTYFNKPIFWKKIKNPKNRKKLSSYISDNFV